MSQQTYLGDGVYAVFQPYEGQANFRVTLDLRGQDSHTEIVLESEVLSRLITFAKQQSEEQKERLSSPETGG